MLGQDGEQPGINRTRAYPHRMPTAWQEQPPPPETLFLQVLPTRRDRNSRLLPKAGSWGGKATGNSLPPSWGCWSTGLDPSSNRRQMGRIPGLGHWPSRLPREAEALKLF